MLSLTFYDEPNLVLIKWHDTTNLATWHTRQEIEEHWEQSPFRCENVGYLIATDGTGAHYVAARKGNINDETDAFGLIERIPKGVITSISILQEATKEV